MLRDRNIQRVPWILPWILPNVHVFIMQVFMCKYLLSNFKRYNADTRHPISDAIALAD